MKKGYKKYGYVISMVFLALIARNNRILVWEDSINFVDLYIRIVIAVIMLILLPHALDAFDVVREEKVEKAENKDKVGDGEETGDGIFSNGDKSD
ncbi:hypothetical protein [Aedoeadaptatus acetigenes]|uniref:hypothetical protein n=1 Tax=Aedoeadaptatus acetigenes TaxID=2981723 RepID=UPI0011DD3B9F|nr:hypothetical protein [Aedoeadaptatus acetigenes]MCU6785921.1 hypothetical protein [Aedoeadaptatus acetigenes]